MDILSTNLEALIQKIINKTNKKLDNTAIDEFCLMVTKENEGVQIASKLLASWIHSSIEWQALQTLTLLDTCMKRCGPLFISEIGKFRFLNEMIKLVSPKYFGNSTPTSIQEKVLNLLEAWTIDYSCEIKIKEAFEMLKKQGVVKNMCTSINIPFENTCQSTKIKNPIFDDEEKSKLLQKLLQSKNPKDLLAANKLIKNMVKEDERRIQQDKHWLMELESVRNNVKLLSDMLDCYVPLKSSIDDIELIKELYQACKGLQPTIDRLVQETQNNTIMMVEASKDLENVFKKYEKVHLVNQSHLTLLDFANPNIPTSYDSNSFNKKDVTLMSNSHSNLELLEHIFGNLNYSTESVCLSDQSSTLSDIPIMQPINIIDKKKPDSKEKTFDHFNELGDFFIKKNNPDFKIKEHFNKTSKGTSKSLNALVKQSEFQLLSEKNSITNVTSDETKQISFNSNKKTSNIDTALASFNAKSTYKENFEKIKQIGKEKQDQRNNGHLITKQSKIEVKPLPDLEISLETITPGTISPVTVIDKNGITVVLHFAKDSPRPDISVIVVTTISKNCKPLKDYLFQAVVPKNCKCKLQLPSDTELLAHNPFLPPSAITQIMLIGNPYKLVVSLKYMLTYTMDGESFTEIGEIDKLPIA